MCTYYASSQYWKTQLVFFLLAAGDLQLYFYSAVVNCFWKGYAIEQHLAEADRQNKLFL